MGTDNSDKGEFKGEPPGPELANGPVEHRSCRDMICCLVFLLFWCGFFAVTIYGLTKGNPESLGRGYDYDGRLCGIDSAVADYGYLYFAIPYSGYLNRTVCVKSCPTTNSSSISCIPTTQNTNCNPTLNFASITLTQFTNALNSGTNGMLVLYDTTGYLNRFCLPSSSTVNTVFSSIISKVSDQVDSLDDLENWISDLRTCWGVIAGMIGLAFVLGFIYMIFVRYCAGIFTWISILGCIVLFAVLGALLYKNASDLTSLYTSTYSGGSVNTSTNSSQSRKILAYICWGLSGLVLLMTICLYSRIKLAIAILKTAADFVKAVPTVYLIPPFMLICLLLFFAYAGITGIYLFSSGDPVQKSGYPIGGYTYSKAQKQMIIYDIFGILWGNAFVAAAAQFMIASCTCIWYFSQPDEKPHGAVRRSFRRLWRYHLGSIAFGSFILAVIQMIRLILAYIQKQAEANKASENKVVKFMLKCAQCYLACFERCIKFLNRNAYIQIALTGKSFCGAAKDAFFLILRNPIRFGVTHSIGAIFILFGKFLISSAAAFVGYLIIQYSKYYESVTSPLFPVIIIFILAWGVASIFLSVYAMAADTILACFVVEEELRAKNASMPLHCPATLNDFINKNGHAKK